VSDPIAQLRLARTPGVGPRIYRKLLRRFGTAGAALSEMPDILREARRAPAIPSARDAAREMQAVSRLGGQMLFVDDPTYPFLLAQTEDPPAVLTVLGDINVLSRPCVGMVGSRNASANGIGLAEEMAQVLAAQRLVVVSGLARGIDTAAHRGALATGVTIACIAGGIDHPYPPENAPLQALVAQHGCVITEAPLGTAPQARHFPRRNRLIAGLSLGVVVVEAALASGSLITARLAAEAGRDVFAVPGHPRDQRAAGCNRLLREGAILCETAADVLDNLSHQPRERHLLAVADGVPEGVAEPQIALEFSPDAMREVTALLSAAPTLVDDLLRRCQLSPPEVRAALLDLELSGRIETLSGNRVALIAADG